MERVRRVLGALLDRALAEHGRDPPALADIVIESAAAPRLWAEFANGYRTSAPLLPDDCFAFCEAHSAWDLVSLRAALRREAQLIYLQMRRDQMEAREGERRAWVAEQVRRLGQGLAQSFRPRRQVPFPPRVGGRWFVDEGSTAAHERGIRLLKENLSPAQRQQYDKHAYFEVTGGKTGKRYRIRYGRSMNIDQLDKNGRRVCGWCFFPHGNLVTGDVMLAQKLALELFESEALKVANKMW
jgi:hypothetical protein